MKKSTAVLIVSLLSVVAIGGIMLMANRSDSGNDGASQSSSASGALASEHQDGQHNGKPQTNASQTGATGSAIESNAVIIKNFAYAPANIRVKKGTTVTWTNQDSAKHDVMPDEPSDAFEASKLLAQGESYSFTFDTVGTYGYFCSPHPYMKATVEVVE